MPLSFFTASDTNHCYGVATVSATNLRLWNASATVVPLRVASATNLATLHNYLRNYLASIVCWRNHPCDLAQPLAQLWTSIATDLVTLRNYLRNYVPLAQLLVHPPCHYEVLAQPTLRPCATTCATSSATILATMGKEPTWNAWWSS